MAIGISMVMLSDGEPLDDRALSSFLRDNYPDLPASGATETRGSTLSFRLGQADVILGNMSAPIPWLDLEGPCSTSILWRKSATEVRAHRRHIIVTVSANADPLELSRLLTQVTAAVLSACPNAIGVYWGNATLVVPKALFIEFAAKILPKGPPVHIWVDARVGRQSEKEVAGFTTGLDALGHMELETLSSPEEPGALRERLYLIADYLLTSGRTIADGDTIGEDAGEKIRIIYSDSAFGVKTKVMRLVYEKPSAKSKWKLW